MQFPHFHRVFREVTGKLASPSLALQLYYSSAAMVSPKQLLGIALSLFQSGLELCGSHAEKEKEKELFGRIG